MALFWKRKETNEEFQEPVAAEKPEVTSASGGFITATTPEPAPAEAKKSGFFGKITSALSQRIKKTKDEFVGQIGAAIKAAGKVDENLIERVEEIMIRADVGAETTMKIVNEMREFEA
ncbi:MAG: signal recognition particle receptor subunit alpha, partial [Candidatus Sumerlaeaceae bacterium]|nr:signal recognition particle receptor subunit alpha [Candidatus Sumerlaeaceae bacterium]